MKGYVISFSAILLLSSMLLFSMFYSENVNSRNYSSGEIKKYSKAEFIKDDLSFDLNKILGTSVKVNKGNNLEITFNEIIPSDFNKIQRIIKMKEFAETSYSSINNSLIKINIDRLNQKIPLKFSNGLIYEYDFTPNNNSVFFYALGNTNTISMDLNLAVSGNSVSVLTPSNSLTPDLTVNFNYIDGNALNETHQTILMDSSAENTIEIIFSADNNDKIKITLGTFNGKINTMLTENKTFNQNKINFSFKAVMPAIDFNSSLKLYSDIDLNYTQTDLNSDSLMELKQFS